MPVTFYMTNDQKPLVVIYDENITWTDVVGMFTTNGYQEPEMPSSYDQELDAQEIPNKNRIVIFANKREGQMYNDPTMAQILQVLSAKGMNIDKQGNERLKQLIQFPENLKSTAEEMGMSVPEYCQMMFEEGDRISPLVPGLEDYINRPSAPPAGLVETNLLAQFLEICKLYSNNRGLIKNTYHIEATNARDLLVLVNEMDERSFSQIYHFKGVVLALILNKLSELQKDSKLKKTIDIFKRINENGLGYQDEVSPELVNDLSKTINLSDKSFKVIEILDHILLQYRSKFPGMAAQISSLADEWSNLG